MKIYQIPQNSHSIFALNCAKNRQKSSFAKISFGGGVVLPHTVKIYDKSGREKETNVYLFSFGDENTISIGDQKFNSIGKASFCTINGPKECRYDPELHEYVKDGAIYISSMQSYEKDKYNGVGTVLHNLVKEYARQKGYGDRVFLLAANGSHLFHYKNGFLPMSEDRDLEREMICYLELAKRDREKLPVEYFHSMFMALFPRHK